MTALLNSIEDQIEADAAWEVELEFYERDASQATIN